MWIDTRVPLFEAFTSVCQTMKRKSQSIKNVPEQAVADRNPEYTVPIDGTMPQLDELDCLLESCFEAYLDVAPLEGPGRLRELLPQVSAGKQRFLLTELIKLDLANSLASSGEQLDDDSTATPQRSIEDYVDTFPDLLGRCDVPFDLVLEEIQLRRENGLEVSKHDYARRFPHHRSMIDEWFGYQSATETAGSSRSVSSSIVRRRRIPEYEIGDQVDDFVILQTLGSGAFANVYLARQVSMSRLVALKVSENSSGDEPQALAQFDHPNIVRVYDQRVLKMPSVHLLYMQFQPGGTLASLVNRVRHTHAGDRSGQLILDTVDRALLQTSQIVPERSSVRERLGEMSWPMAVAWLGIQLSNALENAHSRGVMHRDVKPANVLLSAEGIPKLADFNVSFAGELGNAGVGNRFGGSIGYMAPEHLNAILAVASSRPEDVGPSADLYSLAILLWELWQGRRPFDASGTPSSWTDAAQGQLAARKQPLDPSIAAEDAVARLLEKTLRETLAPRPEDRIGSGSQLANRLTLALHPEAARLFDPEPGSWQRRLFNQSPWLVAIVLILVPNSIAGLYGFLHNKLVTLAGLKEKLVRQGTPDRFDVIVDTFLITSTCINLVAFPLAVILVIYFTHRVVKGLYRSESAGMANDRELNETVRLGHRAAVIGGVLWCIAAVLYPMILWAWFPEFTRREVGHFFLSHVICGGVAAIYPFFGLTAYAMTVLYPRMVRSNLYDAQFERRTRSIIHRCERYLLLACFVPLLGAALLVASDEDAKFVMTVAIAATGLGLMAAFSAYRLIVRQCESMRPVVSTPH